MERIEVIVGMALAVLSTLGIKEMLERRSRRNEKKDDRTEARVDANQEVNNALLLEIINELRADLKESRNMELGLRTSFAECKTKLEFIIQELSNE